MYERRSLTAREIKIVLEIAEGKTNGQIAACLGVSPATVKRHLNNILIKWDCENRTQVAVRAVRRGVAREPGPAVETSVDRAS